MKLSHVLKVFILGTAGLFVGCIISPPSTPVEDAGTNILFGSDGGPNGAARWSKSLPYGWSAVRANVAIAFGPGNETYITHGMSPTEGGCTGQGHSRLSRLQFAGGTPEVVWQADIVSPGQNDALAVAANSHGAFVAGRTSSTFPGATSSGGTDGFILKMTPDGQISWTRQLGSPLEDELNAVATLEDGSVLVAGTTTGAVAPGASNSGGADVFVARLDASGETLWIRQFGTTQDVKEPRLAVWDGEVLVAGTSTGDFSSGGQGASADFFLALFDAAGNQKWLRQVGTSKEETGAELAVTADGRAWLLGWSSDASLYSQEWRRDGSSLAAVEFGPFPRETWQSDIRLAMERAPDGDIFVAGPDEYSAFAQRYSAEGVLKEWRKVGLESSPITRPFGRTTDLAISPHGQVIAAGTHAVHDGCAGTYTSFVIGF